MGRTHYYPVPRVNKRTLQLLCQFASVLARRTSQQRSSLPAPAAALVSAPPLPALPQNSVNASTMKVCVGAVAAAASPVVTKPAGYVANMRAVLARQVTSCLTPDPYFANSSPAMSVLLYPTAFLRGHLRKLGVSPGHAFWSFMAARGAMFRCMCFGTTLRGVEYGIDMSLSQPLTAASEMAGKATGETGAIVAGSLSELLAQAVTYPQSTLTHLCAEPTGGAVKVKKALFQNMWSIGKVKMMYNGLGYHLLATMPSACLKFVACEAMAWAYFNNSEDAWNESH